MPYRLCIGNTTLIKKLALRIEKIDRERINKRKTQNPKNGV
jgi:hypothetical protein